MLNQRKKQVITRILSLISAVVVVFSVPSVVSASEIYHPFDFPASEGDRVTPDNKYSFKMDFATKVERNGHTMGWYYGNKIWYFDKEPVRCYSGYFGGANGFCWFNSHIFDYYSKGTKLNHIIDDYDYNYGLDNYAYCTLFQNTKDSYYLVPGNDYTIGMEYQFYNIKDIKTFFFSFYFLVGGIKKDGSTSVDSLFLIPAKYRWGNGMDESNINDGRSFDLTDRGRHKIYWDFTFVPRKYGFEKYQIVGLLFRTDDDRFGYDGDPLYAFGLHDFYITDALEKDPIAEAKTETKKIQDLYNVSSDQLTSDINSAKDSALLNWSPFTVTMEMAEFFPALTSVSSFFTDFLDVAKLTLIVKVSVLVGFFGFLCNIATRAFRSERSNRSDRREQHMNKKGG